MSHPSILSPAVPASGPPSHGQSDAVKAQAAPLAAVDLKPWRPTVEAVTVMGDETTHGSDLRGSSLTVLETIAPSETVLDPITEDDDPDVYHWGRQDQMAAARKTGNPFRTLCGKFVYERPLADRKPCRTCADIARDRRDRKGRD